MFTCFTDQDDPNLYQLLEVEILNYDSDLGTCNVKAVRIIYDNLVDRSMAIGVNDSTTANCESEFVFDSLKDCMEEAGIDFSKLSLKDRKRVLRELYES